MCLYIYSAKGQLGSHLFFLSWWKFSFLHFGKWLPKGLGTLYLDCPAVWSISFRTKGRRIVFLAFDPPTSQLNYFFSLSTTDIKSMSTSCYSSTNWHNETQYWNQMNRRISLRRSKSGLCLEWTMFVEKVILCLTSLPEALKAIIRNQTPVWETGITSDKE